MAESSPMFYTAAGSMRVTVVDGTVLTGIIAADGSFNIVTNDGTELTGIYHPCGALQVVVATEPVTGIYHPCGALYISDENDYQAGSVRVSGLGALITLSATSIAEDAADNSVVGALVVTNGSGTYTFSIEVGDDPDDKFAISGDNLIIDELLDYETATSHLVTITADNGVDTPITRQFTIAVTNVFEEPDLVALTLDTSIATEGEAQGTLIGTLQDVTLGSTLSLIDDDGGQFQLDGEDIEVGPATLIVGSQSITVRETLADSSNSPRDSVIAITVQAGTPAEFIPSMDFSDERNSQLLAVLEDF